MWLECELCVFGIVCDSCGICVVFTDMFAV